MPVVRHGEPAQTQQVQFASLASNIRGIVESDNDPHCHIIASAIAICAWKPTSVALLR